MVEVGLGLGSFFRVGRSDLLLERRLVEREPVLTLDFLIVGFTLFLGILIGIFIGRWVL